MMPFANPFDFVSTAEAARFLGLSDSRVRQMLIAGELPGQKLGQRSWAIRRKDLVEWKKRRQNAS